MSSRISKKVLTLCSCKLTWLIIANQCQSTLIQSLYVSPGHLSLVYQQNLRGSIQQIAFRMASLNLITFAHMNEAFFFENPMKKTRSLYLCPCFASKKKHVAQYLSNAVLFVKQPRQASILTPLALSKNWQLFGTISHTSKCLQVCRPSSETKLDRLHTADGIDRIFCGFLHHGFFYTCNMFNHFDRYLQYIYIFILYFYIMYLFYYCSYLVLSLQSLEANHIDHHSK